MIENMPDDNKSVNCDYCKQAMVLNYRNVYICTNPKCNFSVKTISNDIQLQIASVLQCRVKMIHKRMHFLGHTEICSRCGGIGRHSFNLTNGDTCFKCNGFGYQLPKLTTQLRDILDAEVTAGKLEPYIQAIRDKKNNQS